MAKPPAMSPSDVPVSTVLDGLTEAKRDEARQLMGLMADITGEPPTLWAGRIIGYGECRYRYESGWEGVMPLAAFATNDRQHTVYLVADFAERHARSLASLGAFTHGKSCLYIKRLDDVDLDVLRTLIDRSVRVSRSTGP